MGIIERIRALCKENGMSVTKLELALGFGNGSITKSSTSSMRVDRLTAIAEYFNVSLDYLVYGKNQKPAAVCSNMALSELEQELIIAFRNSEHREAILALLNIKEKNIQSKAM